MHHSGSRQPDELRVKQKCSFRSIICFCFCRLIASFNFLKIMLYTRTQSWRNKSSIVKASSKWIPKQLLFKHLHVLVKNILKCPSSNSGMTLVLWKHQVFLVPQCQEAGHSSPVLFWGKGHFPFVDLTAWNLVSSIVRMSGLSPGWHQSVIFSDSTQIYVYEHLIEHTKPGIFHPFL